MSDWVSAEKIFYHLIKTEINRYSEYINFDSCSISDAKQKELIDYLRKGGNLSPNFIKGIFKLQPLNIDNLTTDEINEYSEYIFNSCGIRLTYLLMS